MRASFAHRDAALAELARRQYGVASVEQLHALGFDRGAIARAVATSRLHRLHVGVYAVGHAAPRPEARWLAAVLACGAGALLSHRSAGALWRIRPHDGPRPAVTVPTRNGRRRPGIEVHRSFIAAGDATTHARIPVTTVARTLADLAHEIPHRDLARALREAQFLRLFDLAATQEALARRPSRALAGLLEDLTLTRSHLEDRMKALCDRHGVERPATQAKILGHRVDFLWAAQRVVVETDGWESHSTRAAFQADREISNRLQLAGYRVLRFTHADLVRRPGRVARELAGALAAATPPAGRPLRAPARPR